MLNANPKTRRQNRAAGESVCLTGYLQKMSNASTDGDALTLQVILTTLPCQIDVISLYVLSFLGLLFNIIFLKQALCDGLQCLIHIVKWDFSPLSDKTIALLDRKNIVISELRPRPTVVQNKDWEKLQVPKRELWLSLHGEAHFRSLQSMGHTEAVRRYVCHKVRRAYAIVNNDHLRLSNVKGGDECKSTSPNEAEQGDPLTTGHT